MYLVHRTTRWRLGRRIASLENSLKATSAPPPLATASQLEVEAAASRAERNEP